MSPRIALIFFLIIGLLLPGSYASANSLVTGKVYQQQDGAVYIVQEGDSLWDIAVRFKVSMDDLAKANGISDPSQLVVGQRLVIPGLSGIQGVLTTGTVSYGETLRSLSRRYQVPVETLSKLNHLTSPNELYAGSTLIIPEENSGAGTSRRSLVLPGQSLLESAILDGVSPWNYVIANRLPGTWGALPGDVLHLPGQSESDGENPGPGALPEAISAVKLAPTPVLQGDVTEVVITSTVPVSLTGSLNGHDLHFFASSPVSYTSLQGIHAMTEPGIYSLVLTGTLPAGDPYFGAAFSFTQAVLVSPGNYPFDPVLVVSPETIDPAVTAPEDAQWAALTATATPQKLWEGIFASPAPAPYSDCWPSRYGNRRSYNGSAYTYFHTGLDFCGGVGTEILAPAAGRVVFAGPLTVRGNATVIDHGWGVYSAYLHQSEFKVKVGDLVQQGQVIGLVGGTGRVTGPHLHWEIWAGGVQVDPMLWLQQPYPD
jgi:murein DD-endopeptidase MepM/ murein hydrolase activator NlpD